MDIALNETCTHLVPITLPPSANRESLELRATASIDLLGVSLDNIHNLLQMPGGCGEQTMITFAPNTYIQGYLQAKNLLTPDVQLKSKEYMLAGYQRELTFQRVDGSFSAWGNNDKSGSLWLTAFVLRCFAQANEQKPRLVFIDDTVLKRAATWLLDRYDSGSKSFTDPGYLYHREMQGSSISSTMAIAAFVLVALTEEQSASSMAPRIEQVVGEVIEQLNTAVSSQSFNAYQLSIVLYAALCVRTSPRLGKLAVATNLSKTAREKLENSTSKTSNLVVLIYFCNKYYYVYGNEWTLAARGSKIKWGF